MSFDEEVLLKRRYNSYQSTRNHIPLLIILSHLTRRARKVKIHRAQANRKIFYACYGNTAVDLDPLPVSRARLTVVELPLFE